MALFQRSGSRRRIALFGTLAVIVLIVVAARMVMGRSEPATNAQPAVPVTAAVATRQDVPVTINAIGTVQSIDSVNIVPRVMGTIDVESERANAFSPRDREMIEQCAQSALPLWLLG